jgi:hypothetical protein
MGLEIGGDEVGIFTLVAEVSRTETSMFIAGRAVQILSIYSVS